MEEEEPNQPLLQSLTHTLSLSLVTVMQGLECPPAPSFSLPTNQLMAEGGRERRVRVRPLLLLLFVPRKKLSPSPFLVLSLSQFFHLSPSHSQSNNTKRERGKKREMRQGRGRRGRRNLELFSSKRNRVREVVADGLPPSLPPSRPHDPRRSSPHPSQLMSPFGVSCHGLRCRGSPLDTPDPRRMECGRERVSESEHKR